MDNSKIKNIINLLKEKTKNYKKAELLIFAGFLVFAIVILYSYFLSSSETSRDAKRYVDLVRISDELKIYHSKNKTYPASDNFVNIKTGEQILTYQGNAGEGVFKALGIEQIKDPKKSKTFEYLNYYTYATDETKQKFQLMGFYEANLEDKYTPTTTRTPFTMGDKVGIAIENNTSRAIQETKMSLDVTQTLDSYTIYLSNESKLIGDKLNLKMFVSNLPISEAVSCLEIRQSGMDQSGYYYIRPLYNQNSKIQTTALKVYCDMESDGGGWTRIYYKNGKNTCFNDGNIFSKNAIEKLLTKDFAVSDKLETLKSEGSWLIKGIELNEPTFNHEKVANVANCKTPTGTGWTSDYSEGYLGIRGTLSTMGTWNTMFSGCDFYKKVGEEHVILNIGGIKDYNMSGDFVHTLCNNYSSKDNSITSRWDWDNTRVMWVR